MEGGRKTARRKSRGVRPGHKVQGTRRKVKDPKDKA
jgi:hypothetical protein